MLFTMTKKIIVSEYNSNWPKIFARESEAIQDILKSHALEVHHIGSTSIVGMSAKPKIDILCVVDQLASSMKLTQLGYDFKGELNLPLHYYFRKQTDVSKFNVHVVEPGDGFILMNIAFRDYLRAHPKEREKYNQLKKDLLQSPSSHEKQVSFFSGYNLGKDHFIKSILEKAGFSEYSVSFCMHHKEWDVYNSLIRINPKNPETSLDDPENFYFILYKGPNIVGAAHLNLKDKKPILVEMNFIESQEKDEHKSYFINFINKWLRNKNLPILNKL